MKKILISLMLMVILISFTGCTSETQAGQKDRFIDIRPDNDYVRYIVIDRDTKVQYLYVNCGYGGGLTVLVDAEGKPLLYGGE